MSGEVFVDWLTATQRHSGGLPIIQNGLVVYYTSEGHARFERVRPSDITGSYDTSVRIACNGSGVLLSGNVGRYNRQDNLFNFGFRETLGAANRILEGVGLPPFTAPRGVPGTESFVEGARIRRIDLTANYGAGSEAQSRAVIRWLAGQSVPRMKRGRAGDESVWFTNTRHMMKAYLKAAELAAHGMSADDVVRQWCAERGVVRVELELKRRLLVDLGLDRIENVTDEILEQVFFSQTEIFRRVDRSEEPDILAAIPARYRMTAAAWLAGQDVGSMLSRRSLFYHGKVLREYGIDIFSPRNVERFPVRVRVVDLEPLSIPDWYRPRLRAA